MSVFVFQDRRRSAERVFSDEEVQECTSTDERAFSDDLKDAESKSFHVS